MSCINFLCTMPTCDISSTKQQRSLEVQNACRCVTEKAVQDTGHCMRQEMSYQSIVTGKATHVICSMYGVPMSGLYIQLQKLGMCKPW